MAKRKDTSHIPDNAIQKIPVEHIDVGIRFRQDYGDIAELEQSIEEYGVITPITVLDKKAIRGHHSFENVDPDKRYLLLAGGRRTRCAQKLQLSFIPAAVLDYVATEEQVRTIELIENIHREDLNWAERDALVKRIHELQVGIKGSKVGPDSGGHSMRDTAKLLNMSPSAVSQSIKMAEAIEAKPELALAKNRNDARKDIEREEEALIMAELARRQKAKLEAQTAAGPDPLAVARKQLSDAYILRPYVDLDGMPEGSAMVPNKSMDFVEIDPPYAVDLVDKKIGDSASEYEEIASEAYEAFMRGTFAEVYRSMKDNAWGICWFGPEPWAEPIYQWLIGAGFHTHRMYLCWAKGGGQTRAPAHNLGNGYELAYYFRKGQPGIVTQGRSNLYSYLPVPPQKKQHPTERPMMLIQDILKTFAVPGSRVLVPFLGSGKTLMAASNNGMSAVGFDIVERYKDAYTNRIVAGQPGAFED